MTGLRQAVEALAREAGAIVREAAGDKGVREKSGRQDLVTRYDGQVQQFLEERLLALVPEAGFLGEEDLGEEAPSGRELTFIVDPIDGTTNFVKGLPHCGISIGLARRGEMVLGVVYDPYLDELFSAERGGGAVCNGRPLRVSDAPPERAVAVLGTSPYYRQYAAFTFALGQRLFEQGLDVRRLGAASLDLCYVADGRMDCYFEAYLSPWDYAAGSLILQEAGGLATTLSGGPLRFDRGCSLAAANGPCHGPLVALAAACGWREP